MKIGRRDIPQIYIVLSVFTIVNLLIHTIFSGDGDILYSLIIITCAVIVGVVYNAHRILRKKANFDSLTGLPNRALFYNSITDRFYKISDRDQVYVMLMDLNRFKEINDTLGHPIGDLLLEQSSKRLSDHIRHGDIVARLGGDEFAILFGSSCSNIETAESIAKRIVDAFKEPFQLADYVVDVGISIGIACHPLHATTPDDLIKLADIAMYHAKREKLGYIVYNEQFDFTSLEALIIPGDLKTAIRNNELLVHYQPKLDLKSDKITGVEALLRWEHPKFGILSPAKFIPIAEKVGLINDITRYVIEKSFTDLAYWNNCLGLNLTLSINVSADNIKDPSTFQHACLELARHDILPSNLLLEVTETAIMSNPEESIRLLIMFDGAGIKLSIDDFGTGHSSFIYLKHLPIREIKVDRSFVSDMVSNQQDKNIVSSTIRLAKSSNCKITAEGVENVETLNMLRSMGCDMIQGYYIAKPIPPSEIPEFVENFNNNRNE